MPTKTIESQIVDLESLHNAYAQILHQAKQQLETLEVSESTIEQLAASLKDNNSFRNTLASSLMNTVRTDLRNMEDDVWNQYATSPFLREIALKVVELAKPEIKEMITTLINDIVDGPRLERRIEAKILEHDGIESALKIQKTIADLVKTNS